MRFIWIGFVIIFLCLAFYHFNKTRQKIGPFKNKGTLGSTNGLTVGLKEFVIDFNEYITEVNKNNKISNVIAGVGYLVASLTALVSFYIT